MAQGDDHQKILAPNGSVASANKRKGSPCQQDGDPYFLKENGDDDSQAGKTTIGSLPYLPENIWHHVHSLMPLRDAARAACLSHAFLRSWRCYPNLTFSVHALGRKGKDAVDCIMRNHSGIGVKILELQSLCITYHNLKRWLRVAVKPGIEELNLSIRHPLKENYKLPRSLLSDGVRNSLRCLKLGGCTFQPTAELGPFLNLTSLRLSYVRITEDELQGLLSNSLALQKLELIQCNGIICLRIPCELQHFSCLRTSGRMSLKLIECKAPNLSTLVFYGKPKLLLGEALQMKSLRMSCPDVICYARTELPSIMPNLDTLYLWSSDELFMQVVDTPMLPTRFLCLKHLTIYLSGPLPYDYFSLVSFLDASPSLETLSLGVWKKLMDNETVFGHSPHLRQMTEDQHCYLKNVKITGFTSAKGLVELTCYILKNAVSLECLTLDTNCGQCFDSGLGQCSSSGNGLREARRALRAIRTYIEDKVPARVNLTVVGPCSRCHKLS